MTGATGRIGGRVATLLASAGRPHRLIVRDPARAPMLDQTEVAVCNHGDRPQAAEAMQGVDTLFMVSASESPERLQQHRTFVDAATAAGVQRIVYLSFVGATPDATFTLAREHWATEEHIKARALAFTFLRDNLYTDFLPSMVGDDGVIRGPAGDGRVAAVAQADVSDAAAAVAQADVSDAAAAVLQQPEVHDGATYDLTGPQALTFPEIAAALTRTLGRPVTYHPESLAEAYSSRAVYGAPDWQVDAWVSTYTAIAAGELEAVSDAVGRLTGHAPRASTRCCSPLTPGLGRARAPSVHRRIIEGLAHATTHRHRRTACAPRRAPRP